MLPWVNYAIVTSFVVFQFLLQAIAGIMAKAWMADFAINRAQLGYLSAAFYISYVLLQIPVGLIFDKLGVRKVLIVAALFLVVGIWGLAFSTSYFQALISRVLMGAGSAFGFVGMLFVTASWFKPKYFAVLVGIAETVAMLGVASGEVILATMVQYYGWRPTMKVAGLSAFIVALLVFFFIQDRKNRKTNISKPSLNLTEKLHRIICNMRMWLAALYGFSMIAIVNVFASMWSIPYLLHKYPHISLKMSGVATAMIFIGLAIGGPSNAWVNQKLGIRRQLLIAFAAITAILFSIMLFIPLQLPLLILICLLLGFFSSSYIQVFAVVKESVPRELQGTMLATTNMILMSSAPILQAVTGWVLSHQIPYAQAFLIINILLYLAIVLAWPLRD